VLASTSSLRYRDRPLPGHQTTRVALERVQRALRSGGRGYVIGSWLDDGRGGWDATPRSWLRDWAGRAAVTRVSSLDRERYAAYRRACQADHRAFWEMLRAERLTLATETLVYFAHWITPEVQPLRFDTRFFAAMMPEGQEAIADEREITEVRWLTPGEAIEANARGELSLRNPTVKNLQLFDGASSTAAALARLDGREVRTILPRVIIEGDKRRVLLPGEPGYY